MTNRRTFLQSAAALSATPLAGRTVFANGRALAALDAVVVDTRHQAARDFGRRAASLGAPLREIGGDITDLWRHELNARWQQSPAAIAGLTERPALFLLERLAWDRDLRVVYEGEHAADPAGSAVHRVVRSSNASLEHELTSVGPSWPNLLADRLFGGGQVAAKDFMPSGAAMASHYGEPTKLYSWIIAPRAAI